MTGDVITAIDGKPASTFTLDEVFNLLRREGRTIMFNVRRGAAERSVSFTLRRML
jgi:C-terminal processing protease CtpA/Prc